MRNLAIGLFVVSSMSVSDIGALEVQLPFVDGDIYECTQNSGDFPSHKPGFVATQFDLDFRLPMGTIVVAAADGRVEKVHKIVS